MADLSTGDSKLVQYLNEAYGTEMRLETALQEHITMAIRPAYRKRLKDHLSETKRHAREVKRAITRLGGTAETIAAVGRDDIAAHYREHYIPRGLVVTAAGGVDHDALVDGVRRHLETSGWPLQDGAVRAQRLNEALRLIARERADGAHAHGVQAFLGLRPQARNDVDRQRREEVGLRPGRDHDQPVRFTRPARHLGDDLRGGDARTRRH